MESSTDPPNFPHNAWIISGDNDETDFDLESKLDCPQCGKYHLAIHGTVLFRLVAKGIRQTAISDGGIHTCIAPAEPNKQDNGIAIHLLCGGCGAQAVWRSQVGEMKRTLSWRPKPAGNAD